MVFFFGYWSVGVAVRPDQLLTQNYLRGVSPTRADILDFDSIILSGNEEMYRGFMRRNPMLGARTNTIGLVECIQPQSKEDTK